MFNPMVENLQLFEVQDFQILIGDVGDTKFICKDSMHQFFTGSNTNKLREEVKSLSKCNTCFKYKRRYDNQNYYANKCHGGPVHDEIDKNDENKKKTLLESKYCDICLPKLYKSYEMVEYGPFESSIETKDFVDNYYIDKLQINEFEFQYQFKKKLEKNLDFQYIDFDTLNYFKTTFGNLYSGIECGKDLKRYLSSNEATWKSFKKLVHFGVLIIRDKRLYYHKNFGLELSSDQYEEFVTNELDIYNLEEIQILKYQYDGLIQTSKENIKDLPILYKSDFEIPEPTLDFDEIVYLTFQQNHNKSLKLNQIFYNSPMILNYGDTRKEFQTKIENLELIQYNQKSILFSIIGSNDDKKIALKKKLMAKYNSMEDQFSLYNEIIKDIWDEEFRENNKENIKTSWYELKEVKKNNIKFLKIQGHTIYYNGFQNENQTLLEDKALEYLSFTFFKEVNYISSIKFKWDHLIYSDIIIGKEMFSYDLRGLFPRAVKLYKDILNKNQSDTIHIMELYNNVELNNGIILTSFGSYYYTQYFQLHYLLLVTQEFDLIQYDTNTFKITICKNISIKVEDIEDIVKNRNSINSKFNQIKFLPFLYDVNLYPCRLEIKTLYYQDKFQCSGENCIFGKKETLSAICFDEIKSKDHWSDEKHFCKSCKFDQNQDLYFEDLAYNKMYYKHKADSNETFHQVKVRGNNGNWVCDLTGVKLALNPYLNYRLSFDRIDNKKPYSSDNIRITFIELNTRFTVTLDILKQWVNLIQTDILDQLQYFKDCIKFFQQTLSKVVSATKGRNNKLSPHEEPFNCKISHEAILKQFIKQKGRCYYSDAQFVFGNSNHFQPSIERINNRIGYTEENIVLICVFMQSRDNLRKSVYDYYGANQWSKDKAQHILKCFMENQKLGQLVPSKKTFTIILESQFFINKVYNLIGESKYNTTDESIVKQILSNPLPSNTTSPLKRKFDVVDQTAQSLSKNMDISTPNTIKKPLQKKVFSREKLNRREQSLRNQGSN